MEPLFCTEKKLLPLPVIRAACAGNPLAVRCVLQHYDPHICRLSIRVRYDRGGIPHLWVDRQRRHHLQGALVQAIMEYLP